MLGLRKDVWLSSEKAIEGPRLERKMREDSVYFSSLQHSGNMQKSASFLTTGRKGMLGALQTTKSAVTNPGFLSVGLEPPVLWECCP